jgi:hypothetical protein
MNISVGRLNSGIRNDVRWKKGAVRKKSISINVSITTTSGGRLMIVFPNANPQQPCNDRPT